MNHDHVVYEYMGAECSKLRQPMRAILALSRAQLLLIVVTRSRDLSRECHVSSIHMTASYEELVKSGKKLEKVMHLLGRALFFQPS